MSDSTERKTQTVLDRMRSNSDNYNSFFANTQLPATQLADATDSLDLFDTNSITTYALKAQKAVNSVSDSILEGVKAKDVGPIANSLTNVVASIRGLDLTSLNKKQGMLAKLFKVTSPFVRFMASYETATHQIDTIINELEDNRTELSRSVAKLDLLYRETEKSAVELEVYIMALKEKMDEFALQVLPIMKDRAVENLTPMAGQEYNDAKSIYDRLDRKYINLKLTREVALQNLPSIRLTQEHDVSLIEKINEIQVNVIPLWKRQLAIAIETQKTVGAYKATDAVTDLSNEMLVAGAKQLGAAQIEAQKSIERSIIDINYVVQASTIVIETISNVQVMIETGRQSRKEAEKTLQQAEINLTKALTTS